MTTNQLFFALAGLMVTLTGLFAGFFKFYLDAKIDGLKLYVDGRFEAVNARLKAIEDRLDKIEKRLDMVKV